MLSEKQAILSLLTFLFGTGNPVNPTKKAKREGLPSLFVFTPNQSKQQPSTKSSVEGHFAYIAEKSKFTWF